MRLFSTVLKAARCAARRRASGLRARLRLFGRSGHAPPTRPRGQERSPMKAVTIAHFGSGHRSWGRSAAARLPLLGPGGPAVRLRLPSNEIMTLARAVYKVSPCSVVTRRGHVAIYLARHHAVLAEWSSQLRRRTYEKVMESCTRFEGVRTDLSGPPAIFCVA